ncbi:hypothetical protein PHAVU_007G221900 [Phaseolus vulgaris]|uniref:Uncharacterized protein n=1 Tax=Phaseolus vulgaris TaxID=3885 RepID=V7BH54_PHAVU|nr:hypothetical protein PHAVU_007G221900g [Phaseolus vulgaris]ESW17229.1 hypothetical protein PHAVU_007G221900g [Phaseolus vulgaris]
MAVKFSSLHNSKGKLPVSLKFLVTRIINKISKFKLGVGPINLKSFKGKNKDTHVYYTESHLKMVKTIAHEEKHTFHSKTAITHKKRDVNKSSRSSTWDQQLLVKENCEEP